MKQEILEAVKKAKEESKPRNFTQSVDVVITIKDLDVKKPENRKKKKYFSQMVVVKMFQSSL